MGAGINLFRQLFPEDYYAYQTASLESSKPVSKKIYDSNNQLIAEISLGGDELRGLLKVENGNLVAYGDIKPYDGNGTEVFDIVDLGSLDWSYNDVVVGHEFFVASLTNVKRPINLNQIPNAISDAYIMANGYDVYMHTSGPLIGIPMDNDTVMVCDTNYTDATTFKTAMSGKYLIYEKATPTAKSYTPFSNPMISGSTEEFTDSRTLKMFVGHDSLYYSSPFKGW